MGVVVNTVKVALSGGLPAGSNVIGGVTQSGTWNIESITTLPALPTGSNVIGAVTQSGTWNIGSITTLPALATGSNVIGAVTQSGTWNIGSITTLPALPTGSNTIGNVGVTGTVTVATHAVTQSGTWTVGVQGTGAADIGKAEDAPFASGDTGVPMWAVRNDNAATSFVSANGDYSPIAVDDKGRVIITGTVSAQSGVGTTITDGSASVTTTAGAMSGLGADATRLSVTLTNLGTDNVWIGTTTIAANRGLRLAPGQTAILDKSPTPAIWAVSSSGTQTVAFLVEK